MKVTLFLNDKIIDFKLPEEVSGSYTFDFNDKEESKLINIEANEGKWVLYETSDVKILTSNGTSEKEVLLPDNFYILKRYNINYLIHVNDISFKNVAVYSYNSNINLIVGNVSTATINYNCPYLNNLSAKIYIKEGKLILEKSNALPIYINKHILASSNYTINNGDLIEIYGLALLFLNNLLMIPLFSNASHEFVSIFR